MSKNYIKESKSILEKYNLSGNCTETPIVNDDIIELFFNVENGIVISPKEITNIIDYCYNLDLDYVTMYKLLTGEMDIDFFRLLELRGYVQQTLDVLPKINEKQEKKKKSKDDNKVIQFVKKEE